MPNCSREKQDLKKLFLEFYDAILLTTVVVVMPVYDACSHKIAKKYMPEAYLIAADCLKYLLANISSLTKGR